MSGPNLPQKAESSGNLMPTNPFGNSFENSSAMRNLSSLNFMNPSGQGGYPYYFPYSMPIINPAQAQEYYSYYYRQFYKQLSEQSAPLNHSAPSLPKKQTHLPAQIQDSKPPTHVSHFLPAEKRPEIKIQQIESSQEAHQEEELKKQKEKQKQSQPKYDYLLRKNKKILRNQQIDENAVKAIATEETSNQKLIIFKQIISEFLVEEPNELEITDKYKKMASQSQFSSFFDLKKKANMKMFCDVLNTLASRMKVFKKTKEEMIKYIFRRVYHFLKDQAKFENKVEALRLEHFHERNLITFKSMNTAFLKREFSNPYFLKVYKQFISTMNHQFEAENEIRIDRFSEEVLQCWNQGAIHLIKYSSKLPWNFQYKDLVYKLACKLLVEFQGQEQLEEVETFPKSSTNFRRKKLNL